MIGFGIGMIFCGILCVVRSFSEKRDILLHLGEADAEAAMAFVYFLLDFSKYFFIFGFLFLCLGLVYRFGFGTGKSPDCGSILGWDRNFCANCGAKKITKK